MLKKLGLIGFGFVVALLALNGYLLFGQATPKSVPQPPPAATPIPPSQVGRYQILFSPNIRADTFLLDTETGRTWTHRKVAGVAADELWFIETRIDSDEDLRRWIVSHDAPAPAKADAK